MQATALWKEEFKGLVNHGDESELAVTSQEDDLGNDIV